jgi:hypothetical protein
LNGISNGILIIVLLLSPLEKGFHLFCTSIHFFGAAAFLTGAFLAGGCFFAIGFFTAAAAALLALTGTCFSSSLLLLSSSGSSDRD